jgi:DNA modification methylase
MGETWDGSGIEYNVDLWREVLRVLKPGGHLLAFGGTRTSHRLTCAIEDSGFEIRDSIYWVYGCLSEDTEILTINGWEHYNQDITTNPVLCYNVNDNRFTFEKPIRSYHYENKYPAYRIKSNFTDQLVSRNHRVIVERNGRKEFHFAETLQQQESVPFLESLSDLPETISNIYEGTSITKQELFQRMSKNLSEKSSPKEKTNNLFNKEKLQNLWKGVSSKKRQNIKLLFQSLYWKSKYLVKEIKSWGSKELDGIIREEFQGKNDWKKQSSMERWSNLFQEAWKLFTNKICSLSSRIYFNVEERWLCYGTSFNNGKISKSSIIKNRNSSSYRSQSSEQSIGKSNAISEQQGTQTVRSTTVTITETEYNGNVWCVEVPTGAFVARRNGKIFITGNSGFPKSHNVGVGLGTTLKPAIEPITLARKPISERNIALNVLKWGTGGINIDDSRIEIHGEVVPINVLKNWSGFGQEKQPDYEPTINNKGRWPSNIILDSEAGELLDIQHEGASRFFYCAKASKKERNLGLEDLPDGSVHRYGAGIGEGLHPEVPSIEKNIHPTVKPIALMEYLVRLITPKGGLVLDPFAGSFTTLVACKNLGFNGVGIELNPEYVQIGKERLK